MNIRKAKVTSNRLPPIKRTMSAVGLMQELQRKSLPRMRSGRRAQVGVKGGWRIPKYFQSGRLHCYVFNKATPSMVIR